MINANEARIVTNENEYKNILREEEEARLAALREAEAECRRKLAAMAINEKVFEPIGEAIAQRAAEGYNYLCVRVFNSTYSSPDSTSFNVDAWNCRDYTTEWIYVFEYVPVLSKAIKNHFLTLGYTIIDELTCYNNYRAISKIKISW